MKLTCKKKENGLVCEIRTGNHSRPKILGTFENVDISGNIRIKRTGGSIEINVNSRDIRCVIKGKTLVCRIKEK